MPTRAEYRDPVKRKAWARHYYLAERDARDEAGICRVCGCAPRVEGKTRCPDCLETMRLKNREQKEKRYARGQCASCSKTRVRDLVHCAFCEEAIRRNQAAARSTPNGQIRGLVIRAKGRARNRGIPFDLDVSDLLPIPEVCPVLGIPLVFQAKRMGRNSPSLDRLRPELGYVRGNVRVISQRANGLKSDASADELYAVADYVRLIESDSLKDNQ